MKEKLCDATGANQYMDLASQLLEFHRKDAKKKQQIDKVRLQYCYYASRYTPENCDGT